MLKFKIEQLALCFVNDAAREQAERFLERCGLSGWVRDRVRATGTVEGVAGRNSAKLAFNYDAFDGKELELLQYDQGRNWMEDTLDEQQGCAVSHIGMHCSEEELADWRGVMADFNVPLAQEVWTDSHTNPRIAGCRRYHYVIYSTRHLIGVDMKFIVRRITDADEEQRQALAAAAPAPEFLPGAEA